MDKIQVAVFAHNESKRTVRCLTHLVQNLQAYDFSIHVLAIGCIDNTAERAQSMRNPAVHVHELTIGDKANAWNFFIHE